MRLSAADVAAFLARGFHFPVDAVDAAEAARLVVELRRYEAIIDHSQNEFLTLHKRFPKIHLLATWADRLVHEERILDAVECVIGPDILAWSSGIFIREADSGARLAWHQDIAYFGLDNYRGAVRVWIALTSTSPENGTMRYAPGSHTHGTVQHGYTGRDRESIAQGEEARIDIDERQAVNVVIQAGQCSLHHLALAHSSEPNSTGRDRINFTVDYIAPDVRPLTRPDSALVVRGRDTYGYYEPESRPRVDFGDRELRAYFDAVRMRDRRILTEMQGAMRP